MSPSPSLPAVSVVVPVRDGVDLLSLCLDGLAAQDYPAHLVETIVVDNGSTEDVAGVVARHQGVRLLHEAAPGSYAARNTGVRGASGEVLAFTDADCRPTSSWLRQAVVRLQEVTDDLGTPTMIGGAIDLVHPQGRPVTASELWESVHSFHQESYLRDQHFAATANMVTWRSAMDTVGSFDATLRSGGDAQWGHRLADAGGRQAYAPLAVVRHPPRSSLQEFARKCHRVAVGHARLRVDEGMTRRRALRRALGEGRSWTRTALGVGGLAELSSTTVRARYLLASAVYRGANAAAYARAALHAPGRPTSPAAVLEHEH